MRLPKFGVCSWSLRPTGPKDLVTKVIRVGRGAVQLHLDPFRTGEWSIEEFEKLRKETGVEVLSGMMTTKGEDYSTLESIRATGGVRPDATWPDNFAAAKANAAVAARLGVELVTFHAGFIPHERGNVERGRLLDRLRQIADVFAAVEIDTAFETGQETAATLLEALADLSHPSVGVNFDPANMILYGMGDPLEAIRALAPHVMQVHIKDARPSVARGEWGTEVAVGEGVVPWPEFLEAVGGLRWRGRPVNALIEREAGENREKDVAHAALHLARIAAETEE